MPKETFLNLNPDKKEKITNAFLREFAVHTYDEASLSSVVKSLGIAKGSVYQYFEDKKDLFLYLIQVSTTVKLQYVTTIKREDFRDYWTYFRGLYEEGVKFDLDNPLHSHFLHNLANNLNSPSIKSLYDQLLEQTVAGFQKMAEHEVEQGLFRDDIPTSTIGFFLYKAGLAINDHMQVFGHIDPRKSIQENRPVFAGKVAILLETVDQYIQLLRSSLDKNHSNDTSK